MNYFRSTITLINNHTSIQIRCKIIVLFLLIILVLLSSNCHESPALITLDIEIEFECVWGTSHTLCKVRVGNCLLNISPTSVANIVSPDQLYSPWFLLMYQTTINSTNVRGGATVQYPRLSNYLFYHNLHLFASLFALRSPSFLPVFLH